MHLRIQKYLLIFQLVTVAWIDKVCIAISCYAVRLRKHIMTFDHSVMSEERLKLWKITLYYPDVEICRASDLVFKRLTPEDGSEYAGYGCYLKDHTQMPISIDKRDSNQIWHEAFYIYQSKEYRIGHWNQNNSRIYLAGDWCSAAYTGSSLELLTIDVRLTSRMSLRSLRDRILQAEPI